MEITNKINSFEELIVWQRAIDLSALAYKRTEKFPKEEVFGLTGQIRRACNSGSLNISEGSVKTTKGFISQLVIAHRGVSEVLSASIPASKPGFFIENDLKDIRSSVSKITKMLRVNFIIRTENKLELSVI